MLFVILGVPTRVGLFAISFIPLTLHKRMPLLSLTQDPAYDYIFSTNGLKSVATKWIVPTELLLCLHERHDRAYYNL
jgi:hypothetical protein